MPLLYREHHHLSQLIAAQEVRQLQQGRGVGILRDLRTHSVCNAWKLTCRHREPLAAWRLLTEVPVHVEMPSGRQDTTQGRSQ